MAYEPPAANKRCLGQNYKIIPQKKKEKRRKEKRKGKKREKERKEKREKRRGKEGKEKGRGREGEGREGRRTEEERIPCQRHRLNLEVQKDVGCLSVIITFYS